MTAARISRYGWSPDLPDHRDRLHLVAPTKYPENFGLRSLPAAQFDRYDQGDLGSCTGNGVARIGQYDMRRQGVHDFVPSRLAIYYGERKLERTINSDAGAQIRDGMKVIAADGFGPEALWPYDVAKFAVAPPAEYYAAAVQNKALVYERVSQTEAAIKAVLASGLPIVFGITVYESFESEKVAKTGIVPLPGKHERSLGGHCVVMEGYAKAAVLCANSWGMGWGQAGYFTLPLEYVLNPNLADDFWVLRTVGA